MTRPDMSLTAHCLICGRTVFPWEPTEISYDPEDPMFIQSFTHTACLDALNP